MKRLLLALLLLTVTGCVTEMRTTQATFDLCQAEANKAEQEHGGVAWRKPDGTSSSRWDVYLQCADRYPKEPRTFYASGSGGGGLTFVYPLGPAFR